MGSAHHFAISFLILVISTSSHLRLLFTAEGRKLGQATESPRTVKEDKTMWRPQIGSRPPRCERRCGSCARCEAIQVPTNPQTRSRGIQNTTSVSATAAAGGGDGSSNYKPLSWKCRCGSLIYNP